jgi:hypothetical protein
MCRRHGGAGVAFDSDEQPSPDLGHKLSSGGSPGIESCHVSYLVCLDDAVSGDQGVPRW